MFVAGVNVVRDPLKHFQKIVGIINMIMDYYSKGLMTKNLKHDVMNFFEKCSTDVIFSKRLRKLFPLDRCKKKQLDLRDHSTLFRIGSLNIYILNQNADELAYHTCHVINKNSGDLPYHFKMIALAFEKMLNDESKYHCQNSFIVPII